MHPSDHTNYHIQADLSASADICAASESHALERFIGRIEGMSGLVSLNFKDSVTITHSEVVDANY